VAIDFWQNMSILYGGLELAGHGKNVDVRGACAAVDTTPLNVSDGYTTCKGGLKSYTVDLVHMADMAVGSVDETVFALLGTANTIKSVVSRADDGSFGYAMRGVVLGYTPMEGEPGALAMGKISGKVSRGPVVRGTLLHPPATARTSSSTGTGRQIGAVPAGSSMYAALHVLSVSGMDTPTITVKVQSDDNASFTSATDRITFAGATALGAQWGAVAGAVTDDYWRLSYTISGTNPSFLFAVVAGVAVTV